MRDKGIFKILDAYIGNVVVVLLSFFKKKRVVLPSKIKKILLIKFSAFGDTIILLEIIENIKKKYSEVDIDFIYTEVNKDIVEICPFINNKLFFDIRKLIKNPFYLFRFIGLLRAKHYDIVIDFDQWLNISAILCYFSNSKYSVGFKTKLKKIHLLFDKYYEHRSNCHEKNLFYELVSILGVYKTSQKRSTSFLFSKKSEENVIKKLQEMGIKNDFIILAVDVPSHGLQRQWPIKYFLELADKINKKNKYEVIFLLTKETNIPRRYFSMLTSSVRFSVSLILKSQLIICNNTGIMHLADYLNVPLIALHGPTNPSRWGPSSKRSYVIRSSLSCSPCLDLGFEYKCRTRRCMESISVEEVFNMVERILIK